MRRASFYVSRNRGHRLLRHAGAEPQVPPRRLAVSAQLRTDVAARPLRRRRPHCHHHPRRRRRTRHRARPAAASASSGRRGGSAVSLRRRRRGDGRFASCHRVVVAAAARGCGANRRGSVGRCRPGLRGGAPAATPRVATCSCVVFAWIRNADGCNRRRLRWRQTFGSPKQRGAPQLR